jgi:hypothetical protein
MTAHGTKRPIRNVRHSAAIEGEADLARTCRDRRECPNPDIRYRRARAPSWHLSFLTQPADEPRRHTARQLQQLCR